MMRVVDTVIVHCSATKPSMDIGATEIDRWHRERGWRGIGYHAVIRRDGKLENGRSPYEKGAHAKGHNSHTLAICLVGGLSNDGHAQRNFTIPQYRTLRRWIDEAQRWYGPLVVMGHCDLPSVTKDCPCFDVRAWLKESEESE